MRMKTECVGCFRNLGVESRIKIYMFLGQNGSKNVSEITNFVGLKQPTVSYHLTEMLKSGLLTKSTKGKEVFYSISNNCPHDHGACCIAKPVYVEN
jgi:DNA-binding transcriptional ArsR family regulator